MYRIDDVNGYHDCYRVYWLDLCTDTDDSMCLGEYDTYTQAMQAQIAHARGQANA